jgi:peroxiredoxin
MVVLSIIVLYVMVIVVLVFQWGVVRRLRQFDERLSRVDAPFAPTLTPGTPAPEFELETVDGTRLRTAELFRGTTVLAFLSSTCTACATHIPAIRDYVAAHQPPDLTLVAAVAADSADDHGQSLIDGLADVVHVVRVEPSDDSLFQRYEVSTFPSYYVIDDRGTVAAVHYSVEELPAADGPRPHMDDAVGSER